jgi:prevent-host-death family protein
MAVKISIRELQEHLPELLDRAVQTGEAYVVQRNGKDYAVVVSARDWKRRSIGKQLDALGPAYRMAPEKQQRTDQLLAISKERRLTRTERRELDALLSDADDVMLRRADAMERAG